jgi:hypothetical protein
VFEVLVRSVDVPVDLVLHGAGGRGCWNTAHHIKEVRPTGTQC